MVMYFWIVYDELVVASVDAGKVRVSISGFTPVRQVHSSLPTPHLIVLPLHTPAALPAAQASSSIS